MATMITISALTGAVATVEIEDDFPPPDLSMDDYRAAIDAEVESTARGRGYNGAAHMAGYVTSTVPRWAEEAAAFIVWRDMVWLSVFATLNLVEAGKEAVPTLEKLVAGLPAPKWPEG